MPARTRHLERALAQCRQLTAEAIREIRNARLATGLSRDEAGEAVGISRSQFGRAERGELEAVTVDQLCRMATAVGLKVSLRLYPDGDPVRDIAHIRLIERLAMRLAPSLTLRTEVPLHGVSDRRAWDAVLGGTGCRDAVEAETRLLDSQAVERRIALKLRDDVTIEHAFLLVADTRNNREALRASRELLRATFALDTREILGALAAGRCPGQGGIVIL